MLRFPEREEGESDTHWQTRIQDQYQRPRVLHGGKEPPPPPSGPRLPRFLPRPWWRPVSYLLAVGAGAFIMSSYDRANAPTAVTPPVLPTRSPIELIVVSNDESTFTTPELVKAAKRVADMEQFLRGVLIYPDIRINTAGTGALNDEELNKLMINANIGERVAAWEFNESNHYNLTVTNTYEYDGRLSRKFLRLSLTNNRAEPTRPFTDSSGLIRTADLDTVRRSILREPRVINYGPSTVNYPSSGINAPARRGLTIDAVTGALIEVINDNRGRIRLWETEPFYTDPG